MRCMPPWMIGCLIPKSSVIRVFIASVSICVRFSGDLQITAEVMLGSAELDVDRGQPLEITADFQFVAHSHAAMDLHGLLANKFCRLANLYLGTGRGLS